MSVAPHILDRFKDRVALVTGAASGIGLGITKRLLAEGAFVVGGDIDSKRLEALGPELGTRFMSVGCDVTREADMQQLVGLAIRQFGGLDLAFNNAGAVRPAPIVEMSLDDWNFAQDVCLKGVFLGIKHQGPKIRPGGAIVNLGSINGYMPAHGFAAYTSAKAGVEMLTRNAALELAELNIRVNAVLPGIIATPGASLFIQTKEVFDVIMRQVPAGRAGTPEDVASAALYLASPEAAYINGSALVIDGGWSLTNYPDIRFFLNDLAKSKK